MTLWLWDRVTDALWPLVRLHGWAMVHRTAAFYAMLEKRRDG
jgi:hypothetical protein